MVGAIVADEGDEIFAIKSSGEVIRTPVGDIRATGRDTMGVTLTSVGEGDAVVAVTRNPEADELEDDGDEAMAESADAEDGPVNETDEGQAP